MDFNKDRLMAFGHYDLIINKAFYRTMALITIFVATGITFVGFLGRWLIHSSSHNTNNLDNFEHYSNMPFTTLFLVTFLAVMHAIFAGCTFHNLRNKQGRIKELTLPCSNLEKFIWHMFISLIGGFMLICSALIIADAFNAVLNLIFLPLDAQSSIIYRVIETFGFGDNYIMKSRDGMYLIENFPNMIYAMRFMAFCMILSGTLFFVLGNAVKYKYNIILTYLVYELSLIAIVFTFIFSILSVDNSKADINIDEDTAISYFIIICNFIGFINILLTALYSWWSYKLYKRAQVTSGWNK